MLDFIRSLIKKRFQLAHMSSITMYLGHIVNMLEEEYVLDRDSKNSAIDAICDLLQEYKDPENKGK